MSSTDNGVLEFELFDADGGTHTYHMAAHQGGDGSELVMQLIQLGGEPLARLIQVWMSSEKGVDEDFSVIAKNFDFAEIAKDLKSALATMNAPNLLREFLRNASRDGKPLSNRANWDAAWSRNYGEMLQAVWKSVEYNRFIPFAHTLFGN